MVIVFAGKTEDPSKLVPLLESFIEAMTSKNDNILTSTQNYINFADDKVSEFQEPSFRIPHNNAFFQNLQKSLGHQAGNREIKPIFTKHTKAQQLKLT